MRAGGGRGKLARGALALALVLAVVAPSASDAAPKSSTAGTVNVRRGAWAGLQIDIADVHPGKRFAIKAAQANGSVTALRSVVTLCGACVVAINADFYHPPTRQPIGGVIVNGVVLRSPNTRQNQLTIGPDGYISARTMRWLGRIMFGTTTMPVAVNDPGAGTPTLYDRRFGATTPPGHAYELLFTPHPSTALRLGQAMRLEFKGTHTPGGPIPAGRVVLRATGTYAARVRQQEGRLRAHKIKTKLSLATNPKAANSLGANHVILRHGRLVPIPENDDFVNGKHPRTLFGWDSHGRITLVTIGSAVAGRRAGVSLHDAARIMASLGVPNAVNLDGGGSSTFVTHGQIRNHPSDGPARPVTNAWVVVPRRTG